MPQEYLKSAIYRDLELSAQATRELMALPQPPTCILYPDDYAYAGGMRVLMDMGLRIPQDVSVAGYDGIPLSQLLYPKLITVLQDGETAGLSAGCAILEAIRSPRTFQPMHITIPSTLLPGESVQDLNRA